MFFSDIKHDSQDNLCILKSNPTQHEIMCSLIKQVENAQPEVRTRRLALANIPVQAPNLVSEPSMLYVNNPPIATK